MQTEIDPKEPIKVEKRPKKKKKNDSVVGYLLVAPALILILAISIWPVIQSFYFSLFDLQLNEPTKSEVHLDYQIDLDRYLQNFPFLVGAIDSEIDKGNSSEELTTIKSTLENLDEGIKEKPEAQENYDTINAKLDNFENVPADMKYIEIEEDVAQEFTTSVKEINADLRTINENGNLEQGDKIVGLSSALTEIVVEPNFVGFEHYKENLTDQRMWRSLWNTSVFTFISVLAELILGLAIALLINKAFIGRGLIRASILIPWAVPTAVAALMWKFLYDGQNGIVAKIFEDVGLVDRMAMLLTTDTGAMFSVIFADVWKTTPYMALLLLAGLQTISGSLYEAASIDGANKWKQFVTITLPLLKSSLLVALLFRTLDAFRVFDLIFVLTGGGPANSTETISMYAYTLMFKQTNFGEGSAISVVVFICVAIISGIFIKLLGSDLIKDGSGK
ncbi:carbohydrate ABC transporter permease [Guptibacillus hwajinpoensis]|uniref:Multiple sugar transport system permease protein n=1 Tax=Guptibacillus hwajinpoensis TaxID=208199 RepID=A0ABU0K7M6_9BACL|nr:sugar ABC transporter permease [Alkalihalobacillus hemicentroti]MDQ0484299.1 multiple sugar transport system permease protein [Alkalihalobacillus hemicentroti]